MARQWMQHGGLGAAASSNGASGSGGISFPRTYDLLVCLMTRGRDRAYRSAVLDLAGLVPGSRVLDVGCGTGTQTMESWRRVQPGGSVTGADLSESMLSAARRKASRAGCDIGFHQADIARLPFPDSTFDVVTMTTVMHMVPESGRQSGLGEIARVLRPGGRLLLVDYAGPVESRSHWMAKHGRHGQFDLEAARPMLTAAGFEGIEGGPLGWLSLHYLRGTKR